MRGGPFAVLPRARDGWSRAHAIRPNGLGVGRVTGDVGPMPSRSPMWQRQWRLAVATGLLGACGRDTAGPVQAPGPTASKVAVLSIAVATGDEGRAFFDNFIPCPRRGVIDYTNTPAGRRATFSGCDAGDGVVVDGDAEVRWVEAGNRERIARIEVSGA